MNDPAIIDTKMHGRDGITAAFLFQGPDGAVLLETGPKSSVEHVRDGLRAAGVERLAAIVVTHIHLDHAGAAGTLLADFPDAVVYVHEVGAPHLENPSKLWSSATRIYGDAMESLWGGIDPIPGERIRPLRDGDVVEAAGLRLRAVETPGHAYHHHAYLEEASGALFTGDALGVRLPDVGILRPATPPPEFHMSKAVESIERIRALDPADVWLTHFGPQAASGTSVRQLCDDAIDALRRWADWVRSARSTTSDLDEATELVRKQAAEHMEGRASVEAIDRLEQTTSYRMNVAGYMRYIDKNEGAA